MKSEMSEMAADLGRVFPTPLHFVGIGGYGMSGLALILSAHGLPIDGCDVRESSRVRALRERGIPVSLGHDSGHVGSVGTVVYSTDVPPDLPELQLARDRQLRVVHRSEILAALFRLYPRAVAVAGTHGKTSCTGMLAEIERAAGLDPTVAIGGELVDGGVTGRVGYSEYFVAEACESDGTLVNYHPHAAICTNVEAEHLEHYGGDFNRQVGAFGRFLNNVSAEGFVVLNADDPILVRLGKDIRARAVWCSGRGDDGPGSANGYSAESVRLDPDGASFAIRSYGESLGRIRLPMPGQHMVQNALMVSAAALELGIGFAKVEEGLAGYRGVRRRFERVGTFEGIPVLDDYAHHPTEIRATLRAVRPLAGSGKVIAVFQPQRYTRTRDLMNEFSQSFSFADLLILTPIYSPPGQEPIPGVSSEVLAELIRRNSATEVIVEEDRDKILHLVETRSREAGAIITMGAGDIWKVADELADHHASG
ncbi:MAG: UDP-N-acetylmuramate--L-alanine ligase [Bacillota bacterium]